MGIQINGQTDTISSTDGSLNIGGTVTVNVTGDATGLTGTPDITVGAVTASSATISGDLTVNGTTTTLDTTLTEVDKLEVGANNTTVGVAITQSGTGDILRLYDGATEVFSVIDGGKVGINKENPSAALSAYHATNNTVGIFESGDSVARVTFLDPGGQAHVGNEGDDLVLSVTSAASEALRIDSSGRVAIGTDTPVSGKRLTVDGDNATSIRVDGNTQGGGIEFSTAGTLTAAVGNQGNILSNSDSGLLLYTATGNTTRFYTGGTETLRINSSGKVGINTNDPKQFLHVAGRTTFDVRGDYYGAWIDGDTDGTSSFNVGAWYNIGGRLRDSGNNVVLESQNTAHNLQLQPNGGDVGIGHDSPSCKLAIKDTATHTAYGSQTPTVSNCMLALYNNPSSEAINNHATIQFGVNGGTYNRVCSISAVAESASSRNTSLTFCTDDANNRTEKLRIYSDGRLRHIGGAAANSGNLGNGEYHRICTSTSVNPSSSVTFIFSGLASGWMTIRGGGYSNAGQSQFAVMYQIGGYMTATSTYDVVTVQQWGNGVTISTTKNAQDYRVTITNNSATYALVSNFTVESSSYLLKVAT